MKSQPYAAGKAGLAVNTALLAVPPPPPAPVGPLLLHVDARKGLAQVSDKIRVQFKQRQVCRCHAGGKDGHEAGPKEPLRIRYGSFLHSVGGYGCE